MKLTKESKIAVVCGGVSNEREISLNPAVIALMHLKDLIIQMQFWQI